MRKPINIQGHKYGRLTVLSQTDKRFREQMVWLCKCECGKECEIAGYSLRAGFTKSCGCYSKEIHTKHGMWDKRIYKIWQGINQRCNNKKTDVHKYYGARGIKCLWKSFEEFYADMKDGYADDLTIERVDNNSHYCKENCKWITQAEQMLNTRRCNMIEYKGIKKPLTQWAKEIGMKAKTLSSRLIDRGWSVEKALTTPIATKFRNSIGQLEELY